MSESSSKPSSHSKNILTSSYSRSSKTKDLNPSYNDTQSQSLELRPKATGWLVAYILLSLPTALFSLFALIMIIIVPLAFIGIVASIGDIEVEDLPIEKVSNGPDNNRILIYDLEGAISQTSTESLFEDGGGISIEKVKEDFDEIKNNGDIKNVVFRLNTPGGSVSASEQLGAMITDLQKNFESVESVFYFDQLAASGGLWASYYNPENYIVGSEYGETGSIGVFTILPNFSGTAEKIGYSQEVIKSSESKDFGNPLRSLTESERNHLQSQVDTIYSDFKEIVKTGRGLSNTDIDSVAKGFVYLNSRAKEIGLIDEVGSIDLAVSRAAENAGLSSYSVWEVQPEADFFGELFGAKTIRVFLGIDKIIKQTEATGINKFEAGKIYLIDQRRV